MSWSYEPDKLATTGKDAVRLLIGDTFAQRQQMQDEEIFFYLGFRSTLYGAAAECCRTLSARYGSSVDRSAGTSKVTYSQLSKAYRSTYLLFEAKAAMSGGGIPYAGGISLSDKQRQELNTDRVDPNFVVGMMDNLLPVISPGPMDQSSQPITTGGTITQSGPSHE